MMVVLPLTACGIQEVVPAITQPVETTNNQGEPSGSVIENSSVGDARFKGETFTILSREDNTNGDKYQYEVVADETSSDVVSQAVYERNRTVEQQLGITIINEAIPGLSTAKDDFVNTFKNSILSGSGAYDMILGQQEYMCDVGLTDLYCNFYDIKYIKDNLDTGYYFKDCNKELAVNNKLYYLVGDYCLTYWNALYVLFFNKQLAESYEVENLYDLVRNGEWTFDKMIEISKGMYSDLNGDAWLGEEDQYGVVMDTTNTAEGMLSWFDNQPTTKTSNGTVEITIDQGKMVAILDKFINFKNSEDFFALNTESNASDKNISLDKMFIDNRAMFYPEVLQKAQLFRDKDVDFGILPMPKWDFSQSSYFTEAKNTYSVITVPIDCTNKDKSGAVISLLSEITFSNVISALYDSYLMNESTRDDTSGEMLDVIRDSIKINFGTFYNIGINQAINILVPNDRVDYIVFYASNQKAYQRNLKKVLQSYEDHE